MGCQIVAKLGNKERAAQLFREALEWDRITGRPNEVAYTLVEVALLALNIGMAEQIAHWLGTVEGTYKRGVPPSRDWDRTQYLAALEAFRLQLGDQAFEAALAEGRTLSLDQAADEALSLL